MRYRKPSLRTLLGVTKAKRRVKKRHGTSEVTRIVNTPKNLKRRVKRRMGYESELLKLLRFVLRLFR